MRCNEGLQRRKASGFEAARVPLRLQFRQRARMRQSLTTGALAGHALHANQPVETLAPLLPAGSYVRNIRPSSLPSGKANSFACLYKD